jgi:hypothetical protein
MQRAQVRDIFSQRPFKPLLVRMVSGHTYRVTTPESLIGRRHVAFLVEDGDIAFAAMEFIEEIRPLPDGAKGRKRKGTRKKTGP